MSKWNTHVIVYAIIDQTGWIHCAEWNTKFSVRNENLIISSIRTYKFRNDSFVQMDIYDDRDDAIDSSESQYTSELLIRLMIHHADVIGHRLTPKVFLGLPKALLTNAVDPEGVKDRDMRYDGKFFIIWCGIRGYLARPWADPPQTFSVCFCKVPERWKKREYIRSIQIDRTKLSELSRYGRWTIPDELDELSLERRVRE